MHDTALEIGRLAIEIYASEKANILELGSMDVNGSLRQFAPENSSYTGVDLEPGKSVDLVVEAGKPLPFEDGAFDLILASSVFEHDPAFWTTFLDLARVLREDGYLYISAPSNGAVHRYPEDHWRFYPDSGLALERWAQTQGLPIRLVESFTAPRKNDQWNDFVAVFRRGDHDGGLKGRFLHTSCNGMNVWTMGASQPLKPSNATEDMALLKQSREKVRTLEANLLSRQQDIASLDENLRGLEQEIATQSARLEQAGKEAHTLESTLRQREEENAQLAQTARQQQDKLFGQIEELRHQFKTLLEERDVARAEVAETHESVLRVEAELAQQIKATKASRKMVKQEKKARKAVEQQLEQTERDVAEAQSQVRQTRAALRKEEGVVEERFGEMATMTKLLKEAEVRGSAEKAKREWLMLVHTHLAEMPFWTALLPRGMRSRRRLKWVKGAGLFDGAQYLELYPDVDASGMDPLRHYILHGIAEGRKCPR